MLRKNCISFVSASLSWIAERMHDYFVFFSKCIKMLRVSTIRYCQYESFKVVRVEL